MCLGLRGMIGSLVITENHVPVRQGVPIDMLIADFALALDVDGDNDDVVGT